MPEKIFLQILNMSFTASFVILFVLLARLLLKKSPKVFSYALWSVVLFRLICPFSFESVFSLLPAKANPISQEITYETIPTIDTGIPAINHTVNQLLPAATPYASINPLQIWIFIGTIIWLLGIAIFLMYSIISLKKLQKCLKQAVHEKDNIYLAEQLDMPFVMGIVRPKIYLPTALTDAEKEYILLHEQTHIRRFDHLIKILSFFVLCLHWFNPLVWVAYFASGRDMEMACDETVIKQLGNDVKKEYSSSLLTLATGRRIIGGTPLAFGEGDTKDRIKNVLKYEKPTFWMVVVAVIAVVIIVVGLLANPVHNVRLLDAKTVYFLPETLDASIYGRLIAGDQVMDFSSAKVPEFADFIKELKVDKKEVTLSWNRDQNSINQIHLVYEGFGNDGTVYNAYFNFNDDFSIVWVDNDVKPSAFYRLKKPKEVKKFFERQLGSVTQIREVGSAEELWKARTKYVGDNSAVSKLIGLLPVPEGAEYDHFKLHTSKQPYDIEIVYSVPTEILEKYDTENTSIADLFRKNALLLLALVDNAEGIRAVLTDGNREVGFINGREWADFTVGCDVRDYAESPEKLQELIHFYTAGTVSVQYTIAKLGKNGEILHDYSLKNEKQLAEAIVMDYMAKSAVWEGIDINTLEESYLIRQTYLETNETQDYYAYLLKDDRAVLQSGIKGRYSVLSDELYSELIKSFDQLARPFKYSMTNEVRFWVKPDEPAQVIGEVAAIQWLNSYKEDNVSETERIVDYIINSVTVLAVDMAAGDREMYDYIVNVHYGITTAAEGYSALGDGISGKGIFDGLFRILYVKDLGGGNFEIVSIDRGN